MNQQLAIRDVARTYIAIAALQGEENKNLDMVLRYIAQKERYIYNDSVQYKKLYKNVLRPRFISLAHQCGLNSHYISYRQYSAMRKSARGKCSINICVYAFALYKIMLEYNQKADLEPLYDNMTYSQYLLRCLVNSITSLLNQREELANRVGGAIVGIIEQMSQCITCLDNETGKNLQKIYNNVW